MPATSRPRFNVRRLPALAGFTVLAFLTAHAAGQDTVILRDGTVLKGKLVKDKESIFDKASGINVVVDKAGGLEAIFDGTKWTFFGTHSRQVGEFIKDENPKSNEVVFLRPALPKSSHDVPQGFGQIHFTPWDKKWRRTMKITFDKGGFETIEQAITRITPKVVWIVSVTHNQKSFVSTTDFLPTDLLSLLSTHPDLVEQPGKPDVMKRLRIVEF